MKLENLNCSRGAPMGRREYHAHGMDDLTFELEWVPLVDGDYDYGGAYWGSPADLYCAVAELDGEELARHFIRAEDREDAMAAIRNDYPDAAFLPENGSLIRETIACLEGLKVAEEDEDLLEDIERDIEDLQILLHDEKGL